MARLIARITTVVAMLAIAGCMTFNLASRVEPQEPQRAINMTRPVPYSALNMTRPVLYSPVRM